MGLFTDEELTYMICGKLPSPTRPAPPMPTCKPPIKSAEEMLKKALEFANQGLEEHRDYLFQDSLYNEGKYYAYEDMAAHLEMLIKETRQNG